MPPAAISSPGRSTSDLGRSLDVRAAAPRHAPDTFERVAENLVRRRLLDRPLEAETIGRYQILDTIGRGAFGAVYRAHDPQLHRDVAIKVLSRPPTAFGGDEARFMREARSIAAVCHPNVVSVFDVGIYSTTRGRRRVFIAMELVRGMSLRDWLTIQARPWPEIVRVFRGAAQGLAAAHARGIIHRDFKPANVIVTDAGDAKVVDFGLARPADGSAAAASTNPIDDRDDTRSRDRVSLTESGFVMGTPRYMAPEQHTGADVGPAADQYAFAVALFEALHDAPPFAADSADELAVLKRSGAIRTVPRRRDIPRWLSRVVARGLAVDPQARWPSMTALADRLRPRGRRGPLVAGIAAAVLTAGIAGATVPGPSVAATPCDPHDDPVGAVYDDARRERIRRGLARLDSAPGRHAAAEVPAMLDAYVASAQAAHDDACRSSTTTPLDATTRRLACIDERLLDLEAVSELLEDPDEAIADEATRVVARLGTFERCRDPSPRPWLEGDAAARDREHRRRLAHLRVRREVGDHRSNIATGRELVDDIRGAG